MDARGAGLYNSDMTQTFEPRILNYNLFGEDTDLPDVVHCETIELRSRLHDWEFAPHRHARLHQILFLESGHGLATLDGAQVELTEGTLVNVPAGIVHGYSFASATNGLVVTLAREVLDEALHPAEGLQRVLDAAAVLRADSDCRHSLALMARNFADREFARAQVLRSLAGLLLGQIARLVVASGFAQGAAPAPDLLARFERMLDAHFAEQWGVARYARELAVSATHLSRIARAATGRSAQRLIEDRVIREARRNLVYTNLPVSTIAYTLGYADPAYFSRVFSRATGLAPSQFRAQATGADGA